MKRLSYLALVLAVILSLTACTPQTPTPETNPDSTTTTNGEGPQTSEPTDHDENYGGTFIVGIPADPSAFMGAITTDTYDKYAWQPMAIGMLNYDAANNMEPVCSELAESYEFSDDYMHLTFHLKDAVWTDDTPITSGDVKFTIEEMLIPYSPNMRNALVDLESIECPDDLTVVINLSKPNKALIGFWHSFYCSILPEHVWADYTENYQECPEYQNPTVTAGPFIRSEYAAGDHITYVKNDKYFEQDRPYVDTLILKIIPDQTTMGEAIELGEIDLAPCAAISYDECDRLRDVEGVTVFDVGKELRTTVYYIGLNSQSETLKDKEVRVALIEAVNQNVLIENVFNGYGKPSYSPIPDNAAFNEIRIDPDEMYTYNPESAAKRLDAVGLSVESGSERDLTISIVAENNEKERMLAESLRSFWADIGVKTEITLLDRAALADRVWRDRDYDVCFIDGGLSSDFSATANRYSSAYEGNYTNQGNLRNERIDEIFTIVGSQDDSTQKELYAELQNLIASEAANIWLQNWAPYAVRSNIGGAPFRPDVQFDNWANAWIK